MSEDARLKRVAEILETLTTPNLRPEERARLERELDGLGRLPLSLEQPEAPGGQDAVVKAYSNPN